jgi:hypothetical protein
MLQVGMLLQENKRQVRSVFMDMIEHRTFDEIQVGSVLGLLLVRKKWQVRL